MTSQGFTLAPGFSLTAVDLREQSAAPGWLHRHAGKHVSGEHCWCSPVLITTEWVQARTLRELQAWLDEFYRVH